MHVPYMVSPCLIRSKLHLPQLIFSHLGLPHYCDQLIAPKFLSPCLSHQFSVTKFLQESFPVTNFLSPISCHQFPVTSCHFLSFPVTHFLSFPVIFCLASKAQKPYKIRVLVISCHFLSPISCHFLSFPVISCHPFPVMSCHFLSPNFCHFLSPICCNFHFSVLNVLSCYLTSSLFPSILCSGHCLSNVSCNSFCMFAT